jgi:hypothetical protein
MVPSMIKREWEDLVKGDFNPKLSSLSLQLKLNALRLDLRLNKTDIKQASKDLYNFCVQNEKMVQKDIASIFSLTNSLSYS